MLRDQATTRVYELESGNLSSNPEHLKEELNSAVVSRRVTVIDIPLA